MKNYPVLGFDPIEDHKLIDYYLWRRIIADEKDRLNRNNYDDEDAVEHYLCLASCVYDGRFVTFLGHDYYGAKDLQVCLQYIEETNET